MNGHETKFTVVIPTYDGRLSLLDTVASVLEQTHAGFEVIVVSDGEGSRTRSILAPVTDTRLRVFEQEKLGSAYARNLGLEHASYEWVVFLDDDDRARPDWLSNWATVLDDESLGATCAIDHHRSDQPTRTKNCRLDRSSSRMDASYILAGGFVLRRDLLQEIDGYDHALRASQNQDLGLRYCDLLNQRRILGDILHVPAIGVDVFTEPSATRHGRYGTSRRDAAYLFLDRYASRLSDDPAMKASLYRIASAGERAVGNAAAARRTALAAIRYQPRAWRNYRTALQALFPGAVSVAKTARDRLPSRSRENLEP